MATIPQNVSGKMLVNLLKAELQNASSQVQDLFEEIVKQWPAASTQTIQVVATGMPTAPGIGVKLSATGIRLKKLEK